MKTKPLDSAALLGAGYGLVPLIAGADKFTNRLAYWPRYLSPWARKRLPMTGPTFMKIVGVIEMVAGALVLYPRTRKLGAFVVSAWLAGITANLISTGEYFDIAARDALLSVGAWGLGQLLREREAAREVEPLLGVEREILVEEALEQAAWPAPEQAPRTH